MSEKSIQFCAWVLCLTAISLFLVIQIAPGLAYYPPLAADEGWILSPAYKLATRNVFGSDLYRGFHNSGQRFYLLPNFHHLLIAAVFKILHPGIETARYISLFSALMLLWTVSYLALRWYGFGAGILTAILLSAWRSHLSDDLFGLPWLAIARSARYDASALAWFWSAILLLDRYLDKPRAWLGVLLGICCAAASISQFYTAVILPLGVILLVWKQRLAIIHVRANGWLLGGLAVVYVPYLIYIILDPASFLAQNTIGIAPRARFTDPLFYLGNLVREGQRYQLFISRAIFDSSSVAKGIGTVFAIASFGLALLALVSRLRLYQRQGDMILALALVSSILLLTVLETTKAPLYTVALYPALCISLGACFSDIYRWTPSRAYRLAVLIGTSGLLIAITLETQSALDLDREKMLNTSKYDSLSERILTALPRRDHVLTSDRMAWILRENAPLSTNYLAIEVQKERLRANRSTLSAWLGHNQIAIILLDDAAFVDLAHAPGLRDAFMGFLAKCASLKSLFQDPTYGWIHIYQNFDHSACLSHPNPHTGHTLDQPLSR